MRLLDSDESRRSELVKILLLRRRTVQGKQVRRVVVLIEGLLESIPTRLFAQTTARAAATLAATRAGLAALVRVN